MILSVAAQRVLMVGFDGRVLRERADRLLSDGYEVEVALDGRTACERLADCGPDTCVLCSVTAPGAVLLLRALRAGEIGGADPRLPVLVVGADEESEIVRWFKAGADRTLPSKTSVLRVATELRALAGCCRRETSWRGELRAGNVMIHRGARTARVGGRLVSLTRTEFDLLEALALAPGHTVEYASLSGQVWGHAVTPACVRRHIVPLRQTLEQAGATAVVETVRAVGLRLVTKGNARRAFKARPNSPKPDRIERDEEHGVKLAS